MTLPLWQHPLVRRRMVLNQQVQEPTLMALVACIMGLAAALAFCVAAIVFVPAFGYQWWIFAAVAASLSWLVLGLRRRPRHALMAGRQKWLRHIINSSRV